MTKIMSYYPLVHGAILAFSYAVVKLFEFKGTTFYLFIALLINLIALSIYKKIKKDKFVFEKDLVIKGMCFGTTQILIFYSLMISNVSNTMIIAFIGSLLASKLGHYFLKETFKPHEIVGYLFIFLGCTYHVIMSDFVFLSYILSFLAGITQGITFFLTKKISVSDVNFIDNLWCNLFWGSLLLGLWCFFTSSDIVISNFVEISFTSVLILTFIVFIAQLSLVFMMNSVSTHKGSILTLSRLPSSYVLDYLMFSNVFTTIELFTSIFILLGIIISFSNNQIYILTRKV